MEGAPVRASSWPTEPPPPRPRPIADAEFDARLIGFLETVMARRNGQAVARRVSFGPHDIRLELGICSVTCHTSIEWLGADGRRRLIEADHRSGSSKHGALLQLIGAPAIAVRMIPEGLQIDFDGGGTLHFARLATGVSFEIATAEFGPALY